MFLGLTFAAFALSLHLSSASAASNNASDSSRPPTWNTYRPNLYFGLRTDVPGDTLQTGLLWTGVQPGQGSQSIARVRHACEQDDGVASYNWLRHDGRSAGTQEIMDTENNVWLRVHYLKVPGGNQGGSWAVRVEGEPIHSNQETRISLVHYVTLEGLGHLQLENARPEGIEGEAKITGSASALGEFSIRFAADHTPVEPLGEASASHERLNEFQYLATEIPQGLGGWRAKEMIQQDMMQQAKAKLAQDPSIISDPALIAALSNKVSEAPRLVAIQRVFSGPFKLDMFYDAADAQSLSSIAVDAALEAFSASYDQRFEATFGLAEKGYDPSEIDFAKTMTASMIGGIGFFHGSSIVDRSFSHDYDAEGENAGVPKTADPQMTPPMSLLTATPSRPFFPRGFYWDEGFHLLLVGAFDNDLSLDILKSWFDLVDEDGWVAREQILGDEARSKVPAEFQVQNPQYANPPTLAMAVTAFIHRLEQSQSLSDQDLGLAHMANVPPSMGSASSIGAAAPEASRHLQDSTLALTYLRSIYPNLRRHYRWFKRTQKGQIQEWGRKAHSRSEAYRWRGRTEEHVLTSGLDDYPRAKPPHVGELHLDLASWVGFFTRTMFEIASYLGEEEDAEEYEMTYQAVVQNIEDLHWNEDKRMYCDASVNEEDESYHVCHKGYISLFPVLTGLLKPDSPHLGPVLDLMRDPAHLWSSYGLRSLSKQDPFYGKGENYWKGPIWLPMNYMALQSLYKNYMSAPGPHQQQAGEIYTELRNNVVSNVYKEFQRTGFAWEQYNAETGQGQRSRPFTGWTALVVNIMAEQY